MKIGFGQALTTSGLLRAWLKNKLPLTLTLSP
jgi:hypothetical protein